MTVSIYAPSRVASAALFLSTLSNLMKTKKSQHKSLDILFWPATTLAPRTLPLRLDLIDMSEIIMIKRSFCLSTPLKWQTYQAQVLFNQSTPIPFHPRPPKLSLSLLCSLACSSPRSLPKSDYPHISSKNFVSKKKFLLDFSCSARFRLRSRLLILSRALWRV